MQIITCPPYEQAIILANAQLSSAGVIIYPTDTLYGLGCDALDKNAIEKIMKIKKRSENKPFSVLFSSWDNAREYVHLNEEIREKLEQITPGPYTFLLRSKMKIESQNSGFLGCRIADNQFCKKICNEFENPIVSTSANISGAKSPTNVYEIDKRLLRMADLVVDEGDTLYKDASTIIDVELKTIVRAGSELQKAKKWIESL